METLNNLDRAVFMYLNQLGTPRWDEFWIIITNYKYAFPLYLLLGILILWKTGFKKTFYSMSMLVGALVVTYGISRLVKYGVARPRPCNLTLSGLGNIRYPLEEDCGNYGFFSAHASVAMTLVYFTGKILKQYYKYILWILAIWLVFFCYSRIYVGKHYPGDLIVGLIIGYLVGFVFYQLWLKLAKKLKLSAHY